MSFSEPKINTEIKSFSNNNIIISDRPSLIDNKILKKIKKKKIQIRKNNFSNKIKNYCIDFFKNNYGILLMILFLILLLAFRYREVQKRRKRLNNFS